MIGHLIFLLLHIISGLLACWPLVITIPLHLIYSAILSSKKKRG